MPNIIRLVAACAVVAVVPAASAQDVHNGTGTMMVGGMEISVGAGVATLDLPDVRFGVLAQNLSTRAVRTFPNDNNFDHEWGPSITAGVVVPWSGPTALAVTGFFSNIDSKHTINCSSTLTAGCATVDPTGTRIDFATDITEKAKRDVDNWGVQVEGRYYLDRPIAVPRFLRSTYLGAGGDVRAILQDLTINNTTPQFPGALIRYDESLAHYYGGYLAETIRSFRAWIRAGAFRPPSRRMSAFTVRRRTMTGATRHFSSTHRPASRGSRSRTTRRPSLPACPSRPASSLARASACRC